MPKVSVIIPVYNTDQYVAEAMYSILNQTLTDIELIAVNDGSTDNSLEVITKIAESDKRVKIFSQQNKGQSEARNLGISNSTGDYLYFMDSDDVLVETALDECVTKGEANNLDIVFFDADILNQVSDFSLGFDYSRLHHLEDKIYKGVDALEEMVDKKIFRVSPCLYILKRQFYLNSGHSFYSGIIHEDELFTPILFLKAGDVSFINKKFFLRRLRPDSVMTKKMTDRNIYCYKVVLSEIKKHIEASASQEKRVLEKLINNIIEALCYKIGSLNLAKRASFAIFCLKHYSQYVKLKSIIILMIRKYLKD